MYIKFRIRGAHGASIWKFFETDLNKPQLAALIDTFNDQEGTCTKVDYDVLDSEPDDLIRDTVLEKTIKEFSDKMFDDILIYNHPI